MRLPLLWLLQIRHHEYERRRNVTETELSAFDLRLRGNRFLEIGGPANLEAAHKCFDRALAQEPGSAVALAGLSMCYGYACDLLLTADYEASLRQHVDLAERAVTADALDSRGHYAMACALMLDGRYEQADAHAGTGFGT